MVPTSDQFGPVDSMPNSRDEASEVEMIMEEEAGAPDESTTSFRLSMPTKGLSQNSHPFDMLTSDGT